MLISKGYLNKAYTQLQTHLKVDFHLGLYAYVAVFLGLMMYWNYNYWDFYGTMFKQYYGNPLIYLYYFIFYAVAYFGVAIPQAAFRKDWEALKKLEFWVKSLTFLGIIALASGCYHQRDLAKALADMQHEQYYLLRVFTQLRRPIISIIPLLLIFWLYDRQRTPWYGLRKQGFSAKPYILLLLLCLPFIIWASFQPSFLQTYPRLKVWAMQNAFGLTKGQMLGIFEIGYGIEFMFVEIVFRGALVISLAAVMGRNAILPMVAVYAFLHFGKPFPETVASIFGGYLLGILALYTQNIVGGLLIHLGVAYSMEIAAIAQYYLK